MPRLAQAVPKCRKHKPNGRAFVELNGRRHYLGPRGNRVSLLEYDHLTGEWLLDCRLSPPTLAESGCPLLVELIAAYLKFAKDYNRKNSRTTSDFAGILHVMRPLKELYGRQPVNAFGPIALQAVMKRMVDKGWARGTVNTGFCNWLLIPPLYPGDLVVLDNLSSHRSPAAIQAMEAAGARVIYLPPYSPDLNLIENIFSKAKHSCSANSAREASTKSSTPPNKCSTKSPSTILSPCSYTADMRDIERSVALVELMQWQSDHRWSPNQLRHTAATEIRRRFGLEAAQIVLGHRKVDVTQVYAERDLAKEIEVARRIG